MKPGLLVLVLGFAFVLGCRLLLYVWMPDRTSDFDLLYDAATRLVGGENPYPPATQGFPYVLPAVLLAAPFTAIPLALARPLFDVLVGWAFVYALWRYRGPYALLALGSGAYLYAMATGQTTPLMVAAILVPALGFLLAGKPNTAVPLWIARPSWTALLGATVFVALSFLVRPSWPQEWWMALPVDLKELRPPLMRPFGFLLLLAAVRWRAPESRLLLAIACVPQTTLPYELVSLVLIPATLVEMGIFVAGSWIAVAVAANWMQLGHSIAGWTPTSWTVSLGAMYLPMLYLVLRRPSGPAAPRIEKERRRPNRVPDEELEVDVSLNGDGEVLVTVIHLPTRLSSTESGQTRQAAERKAHDKLAAILAGKARRASPK
ncbi:MAG TPA: hypothetical protein VGN76_01850 [Gemmatimonadales bacterium]|nr:hypothetical protein [Gemmatimonadales bacterium]